MSLFGFYTMQFLNLSLCSFPKAGSTMNQNIVQRALHLNDEDGQVTDCHASWDFVFRDNGSALKSRGVSFEYSPNTTNIAIIRDPWDRAVSEYADQIRRGHILANSSFYDFLTRYVPRHEAYQMHVAHAADMCIGSPNARFDHIIEISDISSFYRVSRIVPSFGKLINAGWERCTGGSPSLYMPGSIASHRNKDVHMKTKLCNPRNLQQVCQQYARDYVLYKELGHPFACECPRVVTAN